MLIWRWRRSLAALLPLLIAACSLFGLPAAAQSTHTVYLLRTDGPITPGMADYLERGIDRATQDEVDALVLQIDTPGGAIDTMNRMVQAIRASRIPVIVYVAPAGAIAGSAGTVITLAGHAAAMAPETAIGAASPVGGQGEDLGTTLEAKEKEILKATVRSLAARRGPGAVAMAEAAIDEARAASAQEALDAGLIDAIASDVDGVLSQLDGTPVVVNGLQGTLHTAGSSIHVIEPTWIEQLLQALTNPNLVFLLLAVGAQAILIELASPGGWVAGFIGVVCLALAAYGLGILSVNWFGLVFVGTAFVLFLLEIKAPTHGALAAAGLASLIVGGLVLFNSPGSPSFMRVSIPLVAVIAGGTAGLFLFVVGSALRARRRPVQTGAEGLVGKVAIAESDLVPSGTVRVAGELWTAELMNPDQPVAKGEKVQVVQVNNLRLRVRPTASRPS